jgi:A/G-specific adenine glycosylase
MRKRLIRFYKRHGRAYPWRFERNPFLILCTEILLQKTKADDVAAVWQQVEMHLSSPMKARLSSSFLRRLLRRLGLSRRREWILGLATKVKSSRAVPHTLGGLLDLNGVGAYTACATLAFAYGTNEGLVDGNVVRLFERYWQPYPHTDARIKARFWRPVSKKLGNTRRLREVFWGLLDVSAAFCLPHSPRCGFCPLRTECASTGGRPARNARGGQ